MLGILNTAILLTQATASRPRPVMDPEGYRVARVTGDYLQAWKERALAAEAALDALQEEHADVLLEIADLEQITAHLTEAGFASDASGVVGSLG